MQVFLVSFFLKLKVYAALIRRRRREFGLSEEEEGDNYTLKHSRRLVDAKKSVSLVYTNLIVGILEDLPLGILSIGTS